MLLGILKSGDHFFLVEHLSLHLPVLRAKFVPSYWLLFKLTIIEIMVNVKRPMNTVTMTIINPRKEYLPRCGSNKRPRLLKFPTLPTELTGLGFVAPDQSGLIHRLKLFQFVPTTDLFAQLASTLLVRT